ncbi:CHASE2 domain-containing protein [Accumulibacter sp.]|uniref:CHASE2 domain-containing protein n=2 Tax=Accumulibacter sp. TaxID=2053492 RepID=UPI0035B211B2
MSAQARFPGWPGREALRVALLLAAISLTITASGLLVRVDHLLFDIGQRINWRQAAADVLIIAIDQDSLDRLGRWPWPRERHARLLDIVCAGRPAAVGIDIAFSEHSGDPSADALLADAVARCGKVVLPLVIESTRSGGQLLESPPIAPLLAAAAGIGRIGIHLDEDGIGRSVYLREGIGAAVWPLWAEEVLRVGEQLPPAVPADAAGSVGHPEERYQLLRENARRFEFVGPPGSVQRLSYARVLDGLIAPQVFAGKIVLIGATAVGLGDFLPTPVSALGEPMPGVEVQANVLLSLRDGRLISELATLPTLLLAALLACIPLLWLPRLMALSGLLVSSLWVLALGAACALLPVLWQVWFAPAGALFAGLFAFPLWSWRRLEAARAHLDQELRQLRALLPESPTTAALPGEIRRLGFEQRIAWVQAAQRRMAALEAGRKEALGFISHDLRAPLAGAVARLESEAPGDPQHLLPPLRRALGMAQAFLSLARAEALDPDRLKELDLCALLQQAADEIFALARQGKRRIVRQLPEQPLWIKGDFELLERCAINLLDNALRHAPASTVISIGLDRPRDDEVRFWVENDGPPLLADEKDKLFQRFSRGGQEAASASGSGLGLYFVRTVAERHGGAAGVDCAAGRIRFWVSLPGGEVPGSGD